MENLYLRGDLNQMATKKAFLCRMGFQLMQSDVYPIVSKSDIPSALKRIYDHSVAGWWHYQDELVELNICTKEEFSEKLRIQVEGK